LKIVKPAVFAKLEDSKAWETHNLGSIQIVVKPRNLQLQKLQSLWK